MNSEANDKENGLGRREKVVYALDSQVGSQITYQRVRMGEWD